MRRARQRSLGLTEGSAAPAAPGLSSRLADTLSLSRLLFFPFWAILVYGGSRWAAPVMVLIMLTDLVDGPIARRVGTAGPRGQRLDGLCDLLVVAGGAVVLGLRDWRFLPLALLTAACFACWALRCLRAGGFTYSRLGRYDGAACYLLILFGSAAPWFPPPAARVYGFLLWGALGATALLLGASGVENTAALLREPGAGRGLYRPSNHSMYCFQSRSGHSGEPVSARESEASSMLPTG
jgi:phosphatidylglycerophosphate synthase